MFNFLVASVAIAGPGFPLKPVDASTTASSVDHLQYALTAITLFFTIVIFAVIFYFMVKYRRRSEDDRPPEIEMSLPLEITWTVIPTLICAVIFVWSSSVYFRDSRPPNASMEIFVVGKQWMWHLQHPEGPREIDELHVPVGVPVKLTMTSEDVIHDFFIPAFRIKKDVLPGRYSSIWFQATKVGTYHFFCAQYCGAEHSGMIGWVYVMTPTDYANWLSGGGAHESMAQAGERLFTQLGCVTCHVANGTGRGPVLQGLYGHPVKLRSGETRMVDETYIRQAIVNPNSMPLPNYAPVMPTFQGQVNEEQVLQLIAYVKSLGVEERKSK
ncbi:MAG: cytochrome c oxidase subunit II [Candidatus Acidiferrales bacterium]